MLEPGVLVVQVKREGGIIIGDDLDVEALVFLGLDCSVKLFKPIGYLLFQHFVCHGTPRCCLCPGRPA
jgi:hypothetical protein